ncbi:putative dsRNA-binding protein [bacterium]|nr:putative dsRNA-binding protein [bacterium]
MSNSINEKNIKLQKKINYFFKDLSLLKIALTHSSYLKKSYNYERLEFLGDSIIGSIVSEALFLKFSNKTEGYLSQKKSLIVNKKNLAHISNQFNLINYASIGDSINFSNKSSIIRISADLYESLIGAIFLDSNYETVKIFVNTSLLNREYFSDKINSKGKLIELCSKIKIKEPVYNLINESLSDDDNKIFDIKLEVGNKYFFGKGSKLKDAEENASSEALDFFSI